MYTWPSMFQQHPVGLKIAFINSNNQIGCTVEHLRFFMVPSGENEGEGRGGGRRDEFPVSSWIFSRCFSTFFTPSFFYSKCFRDSLILMGQIWDLEPFDHSKTEPYNSFSFNFDSNRSEIFYVKEIFGFGRRSEPLASFSYNDIFMFFNPQIPIQFGCGIRNDARWMISFFNYRCWWWLLYKTLFSIFETVKLACSFITLPSSSFFFFFLFDSARYLGAGRSGVSTKCKAAVDLVVSLNMSRASLINHELTTPINGAEREATNQRAASKPFTAHLPDRPSNVGCHSWPFFLSLLSFFVVVVAAAATADDDVVLLDSSRFLKIPQDSSRFLKIPQDSSRLSKIQFCCWPPFDSFPVNITGWDSLDSVCDPSRPRPKPSHPILVIDSAALRRSRYPCIISAAE